MRASYFSSFPRHPREGGDPVRAKRIYKRRAAAAQTPAFAGVTVLV